MKIDPRYSYPFSLSICLFIGVATFIVYAQVLDHDSIYFDDGQYVFENPQVLQGLTAKGIGWALTAFYAGNWHPLTWLSHMMDVELFGPNPGPHHLTSLLFHITNALVLFLILNRATGALWPSGFVAGMFALHPLHVESVAWIAERKDVLSTFFWMLTLGAYIRYVENPRLLRYLWVLVFFSLGLMAKPMVVTLPFVLLLLDFWPLGRFSVSREDPERRLSSPIYEKIPLILLSAFSCLITFVAQHESGAVGSLDAYPIGIRVGNALVAYAAYLGKMIWPSDLAVMYPHPMKWPVWQTASAFGLLAVISFLVIRARVRYPFLIVGWLWFLGTLIPVIGLVQVGSQAMADRYTYIPLVGPFIMIAWLGMTLIQRWPIPRAIAAAASIGILLFFAGASRIQTGYWSDSISLFSHTLAVTRDNYVILNNMGLALADQGRFDEAIRQYKEVLKIRPKYKKAFNNLGVVYENQARLEDAIPYFQKALEVDPTYADAHFNLGNALVAQGAFQKGVDHYRQALAVEPNDPEIHNNLGIALTKQHHFKEAVYHFIRAIQMNPKASKIHNNFGVLLCNVGNLQDGIRHLKTAVQLDPQFSDALRNLESATARLDGNPLTANRP